MKNNAVNFWKGIACICVILIHHDFPEPLHPYTMGIYRFAVPFFFMVSGYYFLDKNLMFNEKRTKASAVKMLKYAFSMVGIYCAKSFADSCILSDVSFVTWLDSNLSFGKIFTWIVLNDAPFSGMSWYLWSMVCVYVIAYTVESAKKRQYMYYISPMLLFCHFLIGNLFPVFGIRVNVHLYMNWFLFGLPFFYIGLCIREYSHLLKKVRIGWSVIPFVLSFFEVKIFGGGAEIYFTSTIIAIIIFVWSIQNRDMPINPVSQLGEKISLYVYVLQSLFIWALYKIFWHIGLTSSYLVTILGTLGVLILSYATALLLNSINLIIYRLSRAICVKNRGAINDFVCNKNKERGRKNKKCIRKYPFSSNK